MEQTLCCFPTAEHISKMYSVELLVVQWFIMVSVCFLLLYLGFEFCIIISNFVIFVSCLVHVGIDHGGN